MTLSSGAWAGNKTGCKIRPPISPVVAGEIDRGNSDDVGRLTGSGARQIVNNQFALFVPIQYLVSQMSLEKAQCCILRTEVVFLHRTVARNLVQIILKQWHFILEVASIISNNAGTRASRREEGPGAGRAAPGSLAQGSGRPISI